MSAIIEAPELVYVATYSALLKPPLQAGGIFGTRMFFEVVSGEFSAASGGRGKLLTGGGDWLLVGPDGWGRLDVRAQLQMDDGAIVHAQILRSHRDERRGHSGSARWHGDDVWSAVLSHQSALRNIDPRYAWLQQSVFVGQGRIIAGLGVEYNLFQIK